MPEKKVSAPAAEAPAAEGKTRKSTKAPARRGRPPLAPELYVEMGGEQYNITDIIDAVKDGSLPIGYLQRCTQRLLETDLKCASFPDAGSYIAGMELHDFVSQE